MEYFAALSELVSMIHRSIGNLLKWDILEFKTWTTKRITMYYSIRLFLRFSFSDATIVSTFWQSCPFEIKSILTICLSLPHYPVGQGEQTSFLSLSSPLFFNSFPFQLHFLKHILKPWITHNMNCLWEHFWCCLAHSCTFCTGKLLTIPYFRYKQAQTTW